MTQSASGKRTQESNLLNNKPKKNIESLRLLYSALFQSILSYGTAIYDGTYEANALPLIRLQRWVIKQINLPKLYPSLEFSDLLAVDSFEELYKKDLRQLIPSFTPLIKFQSKEIYSLRGRSERLAVVPFLRVDLSKRNVLFNVINEYIKIPKNLLK